MCVRCPTADTIIMRAHIHTHTHTRMHLKIFIAQHRRAKHVSKKFGKVAQRSLRFVGVARRPLPVLVLFSGVFIAEIYLLICNCMRQTALSLFGVCVCVALVSHVCTQFSACGALRLCAWLCTVRTLSVMYTHTHMSACTPCVAKGGTGGNAMDIATSVYTDTHTHTCTSPIRNRAHDHDRCDICVHVCDCSSARCGIFCSPGWPKTFHINSPATAGARARKTDHLLYDLYNIVQIVQL